MFGLLLQLALAICGLAPRNTIPKHPIVIIRNNFSILDTNSLPPLNNASLDVNPE